MCKLLNAYKAKSLTLAFTCRKQSMIIKVGVAYVIALHIVYF